MNRMLKWGGLALLVSLSFRYAFADPTTVANQSPDWKQVGTGPTWVLPADLTGAGCGQENEPTCEPHGQFAFNKPFIATPGYFTIVDSDGTTVSDQIIFSNSAANGGNGVILFASDPTLLTAADLAGFTNDGSLCTETDANGCQGTFALAFADGSVVTVTAASDGENLAGFDPFGAGYDTSDGISFQGANAAVPEPSSLLMSLVLVGVVVRAQRVLRRPRPAA